MTEPLWQRCLQHLEREIAPQEFNTWIRPLHMQEISKQHIVLLAPNRFVLDRVQQHFSARLIELLTQLNHNQKLQLQLQVGTRRKSAQAQPSTAGDRAGQKRNNIVSFGDKLAQNREPPTNRAKPQRVWQQSPLNQKFTFQDFVAGNANRLAYAAAQQAAETCDFNPLFIYGGAGLGKTHLMQAVGHQLRQTRPQANIVYLPTERFVSDMVKAIQNRVIEDFKAYYRSVDVLLIDDIQFLAGKVRSQEEFFHTFNTLIEGHQQVIMTCDRAPRALDGLEDRLKSRLGSGLTVTVDVPARDTLVSILQRKAAVSNVKLSDEVAEFIANHINSNIRELEGALHRLLASARFMHREISLDFSREALHDLLAPQIQPQYNITEIQQQVADYFKLSLEDLLSKRRQRVIVRPRQMAISLCKDLTEQSLTEIGHAFNRDRSTVTHSYKTIHKLVGADQSVQQDYQRLRTQLSG